MNEVIFAKQHFDSSAGTIAKGWALRSVIGQDEYVVSIKRALFDHDKFSDGSGFYAMLVKSLHVVLRVWKDDKIFPQDKSLNEFKRHL